MVVKVGPAARCLPSRLHANTSDLPRSSNSTQQYAGLPIHDAAVVEGKPAEARPTRRVVQPGKGVRQGQLTEYA